jgi:hypothetical protein
MSYTNLRDVKHEVARRNEFKGNSVYGIWVGEGEDEKYVVYSYGTHYPAAIWLPELQLWFRNSTKYSTTTSRHSGALGLTHSIPATTEQMMIILDTGLRPENIDKVGAEDLREAADLGRLLSVVAAARPGFIDRLAAG